VIQRGTYIASDVAETEDRVRILVTLRGLSEAASKGGTKHPCVAVCGERAGRLWAEGKTDAAIVLEQLFNELAKHHEMDILCIYPLPDAEDDKSDFSSLCAEHCSFSFLWSPVNKRYRSSQTPRCQFGRIGEVSQSTSSIGSRRSLEWAAV